MPPSDEMAFVQVENEGWPDITVFAQHQSWCSHIEIKLNDNQPWTPYAVRSFTSYGATPDEAVAWLEKMIIEELAEYGPYTNERRSGRERRRHDRRFAELERRL